jgi:hypothetical protein
VVSIRPAFGMEDTRVTGVGRGLSGVIQVLFGAIPAKSVQHLDDTTLEAVVPAVAAKASLAVILETPQGPVQAPVPFLAEPKTLPVLDPLPFAQAAPGDWHQLRQLRGLGGAVPAGVRHGDRIDRAGHGRQFNHQRGHGPMAGPSRHGRAVRRRHPAASGDRRRRPGPGTSRADGAYHRP